MKNLPQMVDDLRALAAFLMDGASDLEELLHFLGGAGVAQPYRPAPLPPPPPPPTPPPAPVHADADAAPPKPQGRTRKSGVRKGGEPRKLTGAEKEAIRADWESLPNHQRTAVNRTALSLKHRCSVQQVFALTRSDGHLKKMIEASALLASQHRNTSSSGNAATR